MKPMYGGDISNLEYICKTSNLIFVSNTNHILCELPEIRVIRALFDKIINHLFAHAYTYLIFMPYTHFNLIQNLTYY